MLIPNKFNGYQADGRRLLPIGGGIGEAALIGAALGGGSAAITGGDPLKGALLGGLTGGAGAGLSGALAGGAAGAGAGAGAAGAAGLEASLLPAGQSFAQASQAANAANTAANAAALAQAPANAVNAAMNSALPLTGQLGATGTMPFAATAPGAAAPQGIASLMQAASPTAPAAAAAAPASSFQQALQSPLQYIKANPMTMGAAALAGATGARDELEEPGKYEGVLTRFKYDPDRYRPMFAEGGIASLTEQPVARMSERNQAETLLANGGQMFANGGISSLGSYSDGGRMLKGPGDGMSDSIPASIANRRPARLADGEFVVPADVVSHLGNGSTDAGARQLYSMMDKVRKARTGTKRQGRQIQPQRMMPA
jgi:hypothetical protein